jgi:hypothetical protein
MRDTLSRVEYFLGEAEQMFDLARTHLEEALREATMKQRPVSIAKIEEIFGKFEYTESSNGTIKIAPKYEYEHFKLITFQDRKFYLHKMVIPQFIGMLGECIVNDLWDEVTDYTNGGGIFSPRHKYHDPEKELSLHSWAGVAFDLNPQKYPLGSDARPPEKLIEICARWGYYWGGLFEHKDPMHFEYCGTPV